MWKFRYALVGLLAVGLVACGGEEVEQIDCGENTVEEDGECVPETQQEADCAAGEVLDAELNRCVPAVDSFCGDDTQFDEELGQCVADPTECDENTVEEDGQCVIDGMVSCGEGTVADGGRCVPADDVCGEGTELGSGGDRCELDESVCGEGTEFDVAELRCVPTTDLECGPGTTAQDGVCIPLASYYDELAENPDVDATEIDDPVAIDLAAEGDRVVFTGAVKDPMEDEDGEPVQYADVFEFDADAGDWLEITVFSLGLPEPGFRVVGAEENTAGFHRLSDRGAGIEVTREVLLQDDGAYELQVSNLPQMLDMAQPAGGAGWEYVGFVETMETPQPADLELLEETVAGDIRDLSDNYYAVDGAGDIGSVALIFDDIPHDADAELQMWTDETTLESIVELGDDALTFEPPADSFQLVFDREHAFGESVDYSVAAQAGQQADAGENITQQIDLDAGDYVGLFQYNLAGHPMQAKIVEGTDELNAAELQVSNAPEGRLGLYWYADEAKTITAELTNTSGEDLEFLSFSPVVGSAFDVDGIDGTRVESGYDATLPRGHRHYYRLDVDFDGDLALRIEDAGGEVDVEVRDAAGDVVEEGRNAVILNAEPGEYLLRLEAMDVLDGGYVFAAEEAELFEVSESSNPELSIPDNDPDGITDVVAIDNCPFIDEIEVDVEIYHGWRSDLVVQVTSPAGDVATIHNRDGGQADDIVATYPYPGQTGLTDGEELLQMEGTNGSGTWEILVSDNELGFEGVLSSWGVKLSCEG